MITTEFKNRRLIFSTKTLFIATLCLGLLQSANLLAGVSGFVSQDANTVVLREVYAPITINNANENISCKFIKGNLNSFHPFDELVLSFDTKEPIVVMLRNGGKLPIYGIASSLSLEADSENIIVKPEDCEVLLERARKLIDNDNKLVLTGKRRFLVAYGTNLIEEHIAEFSLGEQLHGNGKEPLVVRLGNSVYFDFVHALPKTMEAFSKLNEVRQGSARLHPRAASDFGLQCIHDPEFFKPSWFTFAMGFRPIGVANLAKVEAQDDIIFMNKESCEAKRQELYAASLKADPNNMGEIVEIEETNQWLEATSNLKVGIHFVYQDIKFNRQITIDFK